MQAYMDFTCVFLEKDACFYPKRGLFSRKRTAHVRGVDFGNSLYFNITVIFYVQSFFNFARKCVLNVHDHETILFSNYIGISAVGKCL